MTIPEILQFIDDLSHNNNRQWFTDNKNRYLAVKNAVENLTQQLLATLASVNGEAALLRPADCLYRIYRDTRFSQDKTPYKTHIGIFMNPPGGKKSITLGHYLHLEPGSSFYAAGTIGHPAPVLKAIRQSIYDEIEEYRSIVEDGDFRKLLPTVGDDPVKTAPKGFPKDWEYISYLRPRNYVASSDTLTPEQLASPTFTADILPYMQQGERFNRFINYTVEDFT